jgi:cytoskeletal protein CcmA (bactofilin family)
MLSTGRKVDSKQSILQVDSVQFADGTIQHSAKNFDAIHVKKRLRVNSLAQFLENLEISGFLKVEGDADISGDFKVDGDSDFSGNLIVGGDLIVNGQTVYNDIPRLSTVNTFTQTNYFENPIHTSQLNVGTTRITDGVTTVLSNNRVSSNITLRVKNALDTTIGHQFLSTNVHIPTRITLTHPTTAVERTIHACFHSNINIENFDDIIAGRCWSNSTQYQWENLSVAGSFLMRTRAEANVNTPLQTIFHVSPTDITMSNIQRINQAVSDSPLINLFRRSEFRRAIADAEIGSSVSVLALSDIATPTRQILFNNNATPGYLNTLVQINDAVIARSGTQTSGSIVFTGWATGIAGGVRVSFTPSPATASTEIRGGDTSLLVHSNGTVNCNRQIFFNSATGTHRTIQNLSNLSLCTTAHNTTTSQTDFTLSIDNATNQIRYKSTRNNLSHIFQVQGSTGVQNDRFIISDFNVTANRIPLRTMSPTLGSDQRQFMMRSDDGGIHYLTATNHASHGTGAENRIHIALGRADGTGGVINDQVFTFRHTYNQSHVNLHVPQILFTGDSSVQSTAFTSAQATQITTNQTSIGTLNSQTQQLTFRIEDAESYINHLDQQNANAQSFIGIVGIPAQWGGVEVKFTHSPDIIQELNTINLTAGTYYITYVAHLYTKQGTSRNIELWTTWINSTISQTTEPLWETFKQSNRNFDVYPHNKGEHDLGYTHGASALVVLNATTTIRFLTSINYSSPSNWGNDGSGGEGKWSYLRPWFSAVRLR